MYFPNIERPEEDILYLLKHYQNLWRANKDKVQIQRFIKPLALHDKFYLHVCSYVCISKGVYISGVTSRTLEDPSTKNVMARAILETMLVYHFVAVLPKTDEEFECRLNCLLISGLEDRIHASESFQDSLKIKLEVKIADEIREMEKLKELVKNKCPSSTIKCTT